MGAMTAAEAIDLANSAYRNAKETGFQAFVSEDSAASAWEKLLSSVFAKPEPVPHTPAASPAKPYLVAAGVGLLAVLLLK